jgi:hypothetical protein
VKASSGPRYVVGCRSKVDKAKLTAGTRVALDMTTLTIMRYLPREVPNPCCAARPAHAPQQPHLGSRSVCQSDTLHCCHPARLAVVMCQAHRRTHCLLSVIRAGAALPRLLVKVSPAPHATVFA